MHTETHLGRGITQAKKSRSSLVELIESLGGTVKGSRVVCWRCDDTRKHPSGSIYEKDGVWKYKCHQCSFNGTIIDLLAEADGISVAQVCAKLEEKEVKPMVKMQTFDSLEAIVSAVKEKGERTLYEYQNPKAYVLRIDLEDGGKKIIQIQPLGSGFVFRGGEPPFQPYLSHELNGDTDVVVCEGEKAALLFREHGYKAICSKMGCESAHKTDWSCLSNRKVWLWADNESAYKGCYMRIREAVRAS